MTNFFWAEEPVQSGLERKIGNWRCKNSNPKHQARKGINCSIYHSQKFPASAKDCRKNWNVQAQGCKTFYVHSKTPLAAFRMTASPGASLMVCSWKCWQIYTNMGEIEEDKLMNTSWVKGMLGFWVSRLHCYIVWHRLKSPWPKGTQLQ